ncbi:MAG: AAA family ATPase [Anaerolineae bacterium]|nr:AAA family ATPase [Anaerolineae bacterium]
MTTNSPLPDIPFIGRENELDQLHSALEKMLKGRLQIAFVSGEAGTGKTALIEEFARFAERIYPDLVVAKGVGQGQSGITAPFLIWSEIATALTGNPSDPTHMAHDSEPRRRKLTHLYRLASGAIKEFAPMVAALMIGDPGIGIAFSAAKVGWDWFKADEKIEKRIEHKTGQASLPSEGDERNLFRDYSLWLRKISEKVPLLIFLDDLHWADHASLSLLFHVVRQAQSSKIIIVGTYRPSELRLGQAHELHPLEAKLYEFERYQGAIQIRLDDVVQAHGRTFANEVLDSIPSKLSATFKEAFFLKTEGHPLFVVELLRHMVVNGLLTRDAKGYWVESTNPDWQSLPQEVEGLAKLRVEKLERELRRILASASVQGIEFHPEILSRVEQQEERQLIDRLDNDLSKRYQLVTAAADRKCLGTTGLGLE